MGPIGLQQDRVWAVAANTGACFFVINGPEVICKRAGKLETYLHRTF
jgi:transitional endoplasmic reticulum ATPase